MKTESGAFTADAFRKRAEARALPLPDALEAEDGATRRGDHDLDSGSTKDTAEASFRLAAVLVPVVDREGAATVILTLRAAHLPAHAGQIAFPGGTRTQDDATLTETALREAEEEIGLARGLVRPIARLDTYHTRTGFRVVPILSVVSPGLTLVPDAREVADVFEVPLQFLMTVANHQRHSVEWQGRQREFYAMPYGERYIWGATAGILRIMYERLYAE